VADDGTPSLSATQSFTVFVMTAQIRITDIHLADPSHLLITWESVSGQNYYLQFCDDLTAAPNCWQPLPGSQVTATGSTTQSVPIDISANPQSQRFYRVAQGP